MRRIAQSKQPVNVTELKQVLMRLYVYVKPDIILLSFAVILCFIPTLVSVITTRLYGIIIDDIIILNHLERLLPACLGLCVLFLVSAVANYNQQRLMLKASQQTTLRLRDDLFKSLQSLPISYFDSHPSGDIMSRLTNDVDTISNTLSQNVTGLLSGSTTLILMSMAMFMLSPTLLLIGMCCAPLMFFTSRQLVKRAQPYFVRQQEQLGAMNGYIEEMISGHTIVTLYGEQEKVIESFGEHNRALMKSTMISNWLSSWMRPMMSAINNLTYLILAVAGGFLMLRGVDLTVGVVFTFILYMKNFMRPIDEIMQIFNTLQLAVAGSTRVFSIMDEETEPEDEPLTLDEFQGNVTFLDVGFEYKEGEPILTKTSFQAKKGEVVAIVGPTGAGKTTIMNLLTKFYEIKEGTILLDDKPIQAINRHALREQVTIVLQDTFLFTDTISANIKYGCMSANQTDIIKAAQKACAHDFIMTLPNGYDTRLDSRAAALSQGQRQLLGIARAILSNAKILILDEATSAVDTQTEDLIQQAMSELMRDKTTFVVAHRLSTIKEADQVLVLKKGTIIERGTHETLLKQNGFYSDLYHSQFQT